MSENNDLPIHPRTGLRAIGIGKRGPWWPVAGGSSDGDGSGSDGAGDGGDPATGSPGDGDGSGDPNETETVDFWKAKARMQESRAKTNAQAASQLAEANSRASAAEAEAATVPAKVAEALKAHLVARHEIAAEDAELFLTAADPDLLIKQVDRLLGPSVKRRKNNNYVPDQGNGKPDAGKPSAMAEFTQKLFGKDT
ncbi:hypothetical protein [Mycobacteroides abscessus]|uniref:hypothetical protein n=1 Tax=Mycobacteroides abscessus TaxID=36809 RepID=UPI0019CF59C4|nr:hypothetical protein [Mycobacteroides abscessus]MBN7570200.1 hypothetical protein [Mycobacteroides abscessus subsp. abscessus]